MSDGLKPPEERSQGEPTWLLRPEEMPSGVRLQLSSVMEAQELTPEVLQALGRAVEGMQKATKIIPYTCPKLKECGTFKDPIGCPSLTKCGDFTITTTTV